jgi:LysM repeat protein
MPILTPALGSFTYRVESGDTLYSVARKFNTTVSIILKFNRIPNPNVIYPGQAILIAESPPEAIIYTEDLAIHYIQLHNDSEHIYRTLLSLIILTALTSYILVKS